MADEPQHSQPAGMCPSAFTAGDDRREYNVYVETATVEDAWPDLCGWQLASQVGPLLISVEVSLRILADCLEEAGVRSYINDGAKAETIVKSICAQLQLIAELAREHGSQAGAPDAAAAAPPPADMLGPPSNESSWHRVVELADRVPRGADLVSQMRMRLAFAAEAVGFDLGIGRGGVGAGEAATAIRTLDYDRWIRPLDVHGLYTPDRRALYVEDPIFVRVHQACEGILEAMLVELDKVEAALFVGDYPSAERHVLMAARCCAPFEATIVLLGEMSQLDYAPLRTALRDASGAQSARGQARRRVVKDHFWLFRQQLRHRGLDCLTVLVDPSGHVPEYRLLQAFKLLGRAINQTMSAHAHLVYNVLGSAVNGTLGARVLSLGQVASYPLLPEITDALDKVTLWTALRYADHSGIVIHQQEQAHGLRQKYEPTYPAEPCDAALMDRTIEQYFAAIAQQDKEAWKATFSDVFHFEDPKGTKPYVSENNLDNFFRNFIQAFPEVYSASHTVTERSDNSATAQWSIEAASFMKGIDASFSGSEAFWFDPNGKIVVAFAEWDPAALAERMMDQYRSSLR